MYDVIVVGARCGGAPTAMLLARKGYKVLLVDRAGFPSDIPHGHFIHRDGPGCLQRWGLLERVLATGCPPITAMTTDAGDFPLTGRGLAVDGVPLGLGPRRSVLDKILVDAAAEAGAEIRERFVVEEYVARDGRITGIRGRSGGSGAPAVEHATVTVGADGRNSRLARVVDAPTYEAVPTLTCWYFSYWSGVPDPDVQVYPRRGGVVFAFPTNDGLLGLFVARPVGDLAAVRADIEGGVMAVVEQAPELAERLRNGRREERFYGAADLPNFFRRPYGPGWALVGDAGCHKDPYLALGVGDAFRDAGFLAEALDEGLSGRRPLEDALADYERRRNEAGMPAYRENLERARLEPLPADAYRLRAALRGDQEATNRYYLAREGMIPVETFYNPEHLRGIMVKAGAPA